MKRRTRGPRHEYQLVSAPNMLGAVRVMRRISYDEGEKLVAERKAIYVEDPKTGRMIGYQMIRPEARIMPDVTVVSSAGITRGEMEAFFGFRGQSRTARLGEQQREARMLRGLVAEDSIERAAAKVATYAVTH